MHSPALHQSKSFPPGSLNGKSTSKLPPGNEVPAAHPAPENEPSATGNSPAQWGLAKRILFRFTFVYLILYMVPSLLSYARLLALFLDWPWSWISENVYQPYANVLNRVVGWVGEHVFHIELTVPVLNGDYTADWLLLLCNVVLAAAAAAVWSLLDRKRPAYARPYTWLRVTVCFYLASQMIVYGMVKVIPNQFGSVSPETLTTAVGDLHRMSLLWTFMAASPAYTIFTGVAELLGGLLLTCRRTRLLGALVVLGVMANVVMLNFCYDVSVKLHSSHLLAMTLFVAAAGLRRLVDFFVLGRTPQPAIDRPLFATQRLQRGARILMTAVVLGFVALNLQMNIVRSQTHGHLAPRPPLHGIWNVTEIVVNGQVQPPGVTDTTGWRRIIIDAPGGISIQYWNDWRQDYLMVLNVEQRTILLGKLNDPSRDLEERLRSAMATAGNPTWTAPLTYTEPAPGVLVLQGTLDGKQVRITLMRFDESQLPLNREFRWFI